MIWLKTKQVAELLNVSERNIRKLVQNNKYENIRLVNGKGGKNGKQYEIALENLPKEAQDRYYNEQTEKKYKPIDHFTGKQRDEANLKAWIVTQYWQSKLTPNEFVEKYNNENPDKKISIHKLFRWQKKYKQNRDVADLIDTRGGHNKGKTSISDEAWEYFYSLYMTQQKLTIQRCWEFTKKQYPDIPTVSAFERRVRKIPEYVKIEFREGPHALKDSLPYMKRDKTDISSNQIWFSDHHLSDTFVVNNKGDVKRLWITVFFDARSNKVMSIIAREASPDATVVKQCLRKAIIEHGVPDEVYFDNGKDYKSKAFSKDYPLSIVNQLGINCIYATPYHGQAKTVERFFKTFEDRFGKLFKTYAGNDTKKRPENMRISNSKIAEKAPQTDEFIELMNTYIDEYNNTPSKGSGMDGKSPNQVYFKNLKTKKVLSDPEIINQLICTFEERVVHKNGVSIYNNDYFDEALIPYFKQKVIVGCNPENIDKVNIYDINNVAICVAHAKTVTPFRTTTNEDYKAVKKQIKAVKKFTKEYGSPRDMEIQSLIAKRQLMEIQYENPEKSAEVVEHIAPNASLNNKILANNENRKINSKQNTEDSVALTLGQYYQSRKEA